MTMGVKVYYSEISGSKEVKKRQQRVMMILESKHIPYEPIDITEPGKESAKDFMLSNAKPKGDSKIILSPQIFSDELYCGDYDDFDLANENDVLEAFLNNPKIEKNVPVSTVSSSEAAPTAAVPVVAENPAESEAEAAPVTNGNAASREPSAEAEEVKTGSGDNKEKSASPEREAASEEVEEAAVAADTTTTETEPTESTGENTKAADASEAAADDDDEDEE